MSSSSNKNGSTTTVDEPSTQEVTEGSGPDASGVQSQMDELRRDMGKLGDDVKGLYNALLEAGRTQADSAGDRVKDTKQTVETFIREKPAQSLAIALGAGWVLSKLLRK